MSLPNIRRPREIAQEVRASILNQSSRALDALLMELEVAWLLEPSSDVAEVLLDAMKVPEFWSCADSWAVLRVLNERWTALDDRSRALLFEVLSSTFDKHVSFMWSFLSAEVLATRFEAADALEVLTWLGAHARMPAKALVPHGLEVLALREGVSGDQRTRAVECLRLLSVDIEEDVRKEALMALEKVCRG